MSERLLSEMKELRDKYNQNFLELQTLKEQLQTAKKNMKDRQIAQRFIIGSLSSDRLQLMKLVQTAQKVTRSTFAECNRTYEELLAARDTIAQLEAASTRPRLKSCGKTDAKPMTTPVKLRPTVNAKARSIRKTASPTAAQKVVPSTTPMKDRQTKIDDREKCSETKGEGQNDVYEVAQLLKHRTVKKIRYFYVRWEGFGDESDSWVEEKDLMCPGLLQSYKTTKKLRN